MDEFDKIEAKEGESLESVSQAVIQNGRIDIQTNNAGYGGNGTKNAGRQSKNKAFNAGNGNDDINQIIQRIPRTMKDEAGSNLNNEENDFMLDTSYGEETMEDLTAAVMLMAQIQPVDGNAETVPSYDAKAVRENLKELKEELIVELQEVSNIFESIEQKVDGKSLKENLLMTISELKDKIRTNEKGKHVNTKFDKSKTLGKLSGNSNVKRALCITPVATKSKNLGATSVVAKSRLSVANNTKATNK
nr:hypothetical protein [Tanacetum cinerariifolium]